MRTYREQGSLDASKAKTTKGADRKSAPPRRIENDGPGLVTTQPGFGARHDQLTPRPPAIIIAQQIKVMAVVLYRARLANDKILKVKQKHAPPPPGFCVAPKKRRHLPSATPLL